MYLTVLWSCAGIVAAVFAAMIYSIATFTPAGRRGHSAFKEVLWAMVPITIILGTALPAVRLLWPDTPGLQAAHAAQHDQATLSTRATAGYNADRK